MALRSFIKKLTKDRTALHPKHDREKGPGTFRLRLGFFRTIAIVIDGNSVQLATGQKIFHHSRLIDVTKIYIPSSLSKEDTRQNFVTGEIINYLEKYARPFTRFIIGVGGPETIFRTIKLPKLPKRELDKAVLWEGNKRIPFDLNKACFGYHTIDHQFPDGSKGITASIIAVSRKEINRLFNLIKPLNLKIDTVYLEQEAIGYLLPDIEDYKWDQTYALINIKKSNTEISYYNGTRLKFTHSSSIGADALSGQKLGAATYEQFTNTLLSEIQNSLDYYTGQFSRSFNNTIFVYGDFSYSDELINTMSNNFDLEFKRFPVEKWTKSWKVGPELIDNIPPALGAVALSMANYDLINFLPQEIKEERATKKFYRMATPALIIIAAVLIGFWASLKYGNELETYQLRMTQDQVEQFKKTESFRLYNLIKQQIALDQAFLEKLKNNPTFLHLNLKELSRLTPPQITLDMYDLKAIPDRFELYLSGRTYSNDPPPEILLAEFIAGLDNSPFFDNVRVKQYSKRSQRGNFILDFQIEMEAII